MKIENKEQLRNVRMLKNAISTLKDVVEGMPESQDFVNPTRLAESIGYIDEAIEDYKKREKSELSSLIIPGNIILATKSDGISYWEDKYINIVAIDKDDEGEDRILYDTLIVVRGAVGKEIRLFEWDSKSRLDLVDIEIGKRTIVEKEQSELQADWSKFASVLKILDDGDDDE